MRLLDNLQYRIVFVLMWLLSLLPLRFLYVVSDIISWILHDVVRYRRKVVHENLVSSFPDKPANEIADIERKYYSFLADYAFETFKLLSMSRETMLRCLRVENADLIDDAVGRGRSVTLLLGHYCNWEWVSSLPLRFATGCECAQVYHKLHNRAMDRVFIKIRTRFGAHNIEMSDIMRRLIDWKRAGVPSVTGLIADQCPGFELHLFVDFLNHDTGVYTGPERIAKFLDSEVFFCHMSRPKRGEYLLRFIPLTSEPKKEKIFDVTRRYFQMLEENIKEAPQYWLWSHRRWKRTRAKFMAHWGDRAEKMLSHL